VEHTGVPESKVAAVRQLIDASQDDKRIHAYKAVMYLLDCDVETAKAVVKESWIEPEKRLSWSRAFYEGFSRGDEGTETPIQHSER
jgi:hypothetical protein